MQKKIIDEIFSRFSKALPEPKTELEYINEFTLLVAIVLSAQATDKSVNKATNLLFSHIKTPEEILFLGEENLKNYIKSIGLFNTKAKNIIKLSEILVNEYNSTIPHNFDLLKSLPGVGRKTANVFLNCAVGEGRIAVDTHVFRVSNRIGIVKASNVLQTELQLEQLIPTKWKKFAHHWLILHGRYTCLARKPKCRQCLISDICLYKEKNI